MEKPLLVLTLTLLVCFSAFTQNDRLRHQISTILEGKNVTAGIAMRLAETGDTLTFNGNQHCPMQSVYKFHLALAVYNQVALGNLEPDQLIHISKTDLLPETWSPIREKYPDGNVDLSLSEVIRYTVSESDNNGCDILFRLIGGTGKVEQFYHQNGFRDISVQATEEEMHNTWEVQFTNWTTPIEAVNVLDKFLKQEIIQGSSYEELSRYLYETVTGPDRIKGLLPEECRVMHKTGSSGSSKDGLYAATNDIGIIELPDGRHLEIAVFISDSRESSAVNSRLIAEIASAAYRHFTH